jgi:hypothetical protein
VGRVVVPVPATELVGPVTELVEVLQPIRPFDKLRDRGCVRPFDTLSDRTVLRIGGSGTGAEQA